MEFELRLGNHSVLKGTLDTTALKHILDAMALLRTVPSRSVPLNSTQAAELYQRIDSKSQQFLRAIVAGGGQLSFREMRDIFGIDYWAEYTKSFGKTITHSVRHITGNDTARLVWWDDDQWDEVGSLGSQDEGLVYIDGEALEALAKVAA